MGHESAIEHSTFTFVDGSGVGGARGVGARPAGTMYITSRFQFIQDATHLVMVGE